MLDRGAFQGFKFDSLMDKLRVRFGVITSVNESKNTCEIFLGSSESSVTAVYSHPYSSNGNVDIENAWGIFGPPTKDSVALVLTFWGLNYILGIFPPDNVPEGTFETWRDNKGLNVNRLPIAESDKRDDAISTNNNDDLVKRGELFLRSSGLADILLDYIGNILLDTHKQITFRIGDRDSDNKISTPEIQVDVGRIVDDDGASTTDKVKIKVYSVSGTTQTEKASLTIDENGKIDISNEEITINFNDDGDISITNDTGGGEITMDASTGQVSINGNLTIDT